ncbi:unnamed protein product [Phytomonas sp. Hart1]|nr:unnamed protein product [Phytomonas sp. Hart1]|eukprot:CCW66905.1 unnamed protein product [Phytomonas sp. isolate Hart1]
MKIEKGSHSLVPQALLDAIIISLSNVQTSSASKPQVCLSQSCRRHPINMNFITAIGSALERRWFCEFNFYDLFPITSFNPS